MVVEDGVEVVVLEEEDEDVGKVVEEGEEDGKFIGLWQHRSVVCVVVVVVVVVVCCTPFNSINNRKKKIEH